MRRIEKPWGYELVWAEAPKYVGKVLHIDSGKRLSLQYHEVKDETIMVQSGSLLLEVGQTKDTLYEVHMEAGDCFHITTGLVHRMTALSDVDVLEVSTPELDDVVRLSDDFGRTA
jgi:mannose-6-phosphate isomerase-like protein (cupin superfamily)